MLSRDEYLAEWSRWHGDTPTDSALVRGWLTAAWTLARPLAGLPPLVATAFGLLVAAAALFFAMTLPGVVSAIAATIGLYLLARAMPAILAMDAMDAMRAMGAMRAMRALTASAPDPSARRSCRSRGGTCRTRWSCTSSRRPSDRGIRARS